MKPAGGAGHGLLLCRMCPRLRPRHPSGIRVRTRRGTDRIPYLIQKRIQLLSALKYTQRHGIPGKPSFGLGIAQHENAACFPHYGDAPAGYFTAAGGTAFQQPVLHPHNTPFQEMLLFQEAEGTHHIQDDCRKE